MKKNIRIKNLRFAYRGLQVLKGVNIDFYEQEFVCLLGKNGSGKSTLFRCLLRIFKNYQGEIEICEKNSRDYKSIELAKEIAYIPQEHDLTYNYNVFDMVLMGTTASLKMHQSPGESQRLRAKEALEIVGIQYLEKRTFHNISGGERKLVLIARAIAQNARIIVMDEPCANLDLGNQIRVMELLKSLTTQGYTIILSSHNPEQIIMYGDRVILLNDGIIEQEGRPAEVITEQVLKEIYDREIRLCKIEGTDVKMCVPVERLTESKEQEIE